MICKDCRHFMPTYSIAGLCNLRLPPYMPAPFDRNVSEGTGCDLGAKKMGRPRKEVEENDSVDE